MGLFDAVRDKVTELLSGAGDKVSELTGAELPNAEAAADQLSQSSDTVAESAQGVSDAATEAATGAAEDVTGAASDAVEPYRP